MSGQRGALPLAGVEHGRPRGHATLRLIPWLGGLAIASVAPLIFSSSFAVSLLSQMAIGVVFALSFNMLLGQGGMLSFGHAVFFGLGGFAAIHGIKALDDDAFPVPLELLPLVGAGAGLASGALFGAVAARRAATAFAMITLGLGELVSTAAFMFVGFFGGESGISADRVVQFRLLPFTYGSNTQVYYLIVAWTLLATWLMWLQTRTPLGRMANAVRDNAERAQFVGYDPYRVRFGQFALAAMFAGLGGGLFAINQELVNFEAVGAAQAATALLMATIGGVRNFYGPVLGAVVVTLLQSTLSLVTGAWVLYFGLIFLAVVTFAPAGLAGIVSQHELPMRAGLLHRLALPYLRALLPALLLAGGFILLVEMAFTLSSGQSGPARVFWTAWDPRGLAAWAEIDAILKQRGRA
jgi:branched-chain amino acid transport system permease protein